MNKPNDKIILDDKYTFTTHTTVSLPSEKGLGYEVRLEFFDLNLDSFKQAIELYQAPKSLPIKSDVIDMGKYDITNIVARDMSSDSSLAMVWHCLSDVPFDLNSIE